MERGWTPPTQDGQFMRFPDIYGVQERSEGVVTAARAIYRTNWTRKLVKMRANGMIEFPLFVRARSIELWNAKPSDLTFSKEMDHCLLFIVAVRSRESSRSICIHLRFLNQASIVAEDRLIFNRLLFG